MPLMLEQMLFLGYAFIITDDKNNPQKVIEKVNEGMVEHDQKRHDTNGHDFLGIKGHGKRSGTSMT